MALSMRPSLLVPSLVSFAVLRLSRPCRETGMERKRFFEDDPCVKRSIRHDGSPRHHNWLCLGLAYRPRIMPSHALAYSTEDLFRHAHNR
ncbi:hypothetical protein ALC53_00285 [Atta colombica]|uniref:Uncharacterized protein n=1 Tax=Atta colombica TaxID=520822 RepID=A0A195BZL2_9HYME|nr:hypothetical protein ALC53_00285 [Atta colombica]